MKVTNEHLELLRSYVTLLDTPERRAAYKAGDFPRAELVKDLDKRYRWDLLWLAYGQSHDLPVLGAGYTDAHIDTALRSLVQPL